MGYQIGRCLGRRKLVDPPTHAMIDSRVQGSKLLGRRLPVECGIPPAESGRWHGFEKKKRHSIWRRRLQSGVGVGIGPSARRKEPVSKLGLSFEFVSDRRAKSGG
jgi:hypothetical protein